MKKRGWLLVWLGVVVAIGCGTQAVEYASSGDGGAAGKATSCTTSADCSGGLPCVNGSCLGDGHACTVAADCPTGQPCVNGACRASGGGGGGGPCKVQGDCSGGASCVNGACTTPCTTASQCAMGQICTGGACGPCAATNQCGGGMACTNGACATTCSTAAQCKPGELCTNGTCGPCGPNAMCVGGQVCVGGACGPCQTSDQCPAGLACVNGACGFCLSNSQCTAGKTCVNGACVGAGGGDGGGGGNDSGGGADSGPDGCALAPVFAAKYPNAPCNWASIPGVGALTGVAAGNFACNSVVAGSHLCEYQELKAAVLKGELATVTSTAWVHRTTPETVSPSTLGDYAPNPAGVLSSPGAGARCNDWAYMTNHFNNGEYVELRAAQAPIYHLAPSSQVVPNDPGSAAMGANNSTRTCGPVGSHFRDILCCAAKPVGCP